MIASNALLSGGLEEVPEAFDPRGMLGDGEEGGEVAAVGRAQDERDYEPGSRQDAGRGSGGEAEREVLGEQRPQHLLRRHHGAELPPRSACHPGFGDLRGNEGGGGRFGVGFYVWS